MRTSQAERERLRALVTKATPGPWLATLGDVESVDRVICDDEKPEDAALIVAAVNALPALLDDLAEAERLLTPFVTYCCQCGGNDGCERCNEARAYLRERKQTPPATGEGSGERRAAQPERAT